MNCPAVVANAVLAILGEGILRARAAGWSENAAGAARESDHVHNLPDLLRDYAPAKLKYYWEITRPSFVSECNRSGVPVLDFEPQWRQLQDYVTNNADLSLVK